MEDKTFCSKCGAAMNSNSRYCMKCGCLNSDHEANQSVKQFIKNDTNSFEIGSGKFMVQNNQNGIKETIATSTGNKLVCFFINIFLFLGILIGGFFLFTKGDYQLQTIAKSYFPLLAIGASIVFFYLYSWQLIYMKCNRQWWVSLIPVYNMMVLSELVFQKRWIGLLTIIPVVGQIIMIVMLYRLGKSFGYNGFLTILFPIIMIPLMGFGVQPYQGYIFVCDNQWMNIEREYKCKRLYFTIMFLFFLFGIGCMIFTNFESLKKYTNRLSNYYYIDISKKFVKKVKSKVELNKIECDGITYKNDSGVYYFYYPDLRDIIFLPSTILFDVVGGYVRVVSTPNGTQYYVSISDGKMGMNEVPMDDISLDYIKEMGNIQIDASRNICKIVG